jgi:hypothetical protein
MCYDQIFLIKRLYKLHLSHAFDAEVFPLALTKLKIEKNGLLNLPPPDVANVTPVVTSFFSTLLLSIKFKF